MSHTDHEVKERKVQRKHESIGPLTDYVGQGDVVHCVIEGYGVTWMGN